ncbi:MAG: cupin [Chloroflexota bacterium]|nr:cupin [Chloroflexota bacterium]
MHVTHHSAHVQARRFDEPDEVYTYDDGRSAADILTIGDQTVVRSRLAPGWSWDELVKPMTDGWTSCLESHREYVVSGRIRYVMEDGGETIAEAGSYVDIPPGHRAWVVGDEECVLIDW